LVFAQGLKNTRLGPDFGKSSSKVRKLGHKLRLNLSCGLDVAARREHSTKGVVQHRSMRQVHERLESLAFGSCLLSYFLPMDGVADHRQNGDDD
jgi:hypothetical protein